MNAAARTLGRSAAQTASAQQRWRAAARLAVVGVTLALAGCANLPFFGKSAEKPKPAELPANPALVGVRQVWQTRLAGVDFPLGVQVLGSTVWMAGGDGTVLALDATSGRELTRAQAGAALTAGVGSDGRVAAVVTRANEVVALANGNVLWRQPLQAEGLTAPLVAGERVFVLAADRSVSAFDGQTGRKLWIQQRPADALVLRQAGVLLAVGDTLVVGQGGRLAGLNPVNGSVKWEAPVATPRGVNDVERLVDLVGTVSRIGDNVCVRAFQAAVGCVDAAQGRVVWSQRAQGYEGVHGDADAVYGTESDGRVVAWSRADGHRLWTYERLLYRSLTAPRALGRSIAVGDSNGFVHLLSRTDGSLLNRLTTDGSPVAAAPVAAGNTLVVVTRSGGVFGFVPE